MLYNRKYITNYSVIIKHKCGSALLNFREDKKKTIWEKGNMDEDELRDEHFSVTMGLSPVQLWP